MLLELKAGTYTVADPGFPIEGGTDPLGGAPTSDVSTFWQKCMRK